MPQLYCQLASRPDPWLLGRTSAGLCTLQTACPLTVTYSGGSPAADTIAAGSAATVYGGSAVTFDASADVWVVFTVPGSGALQVTKEADLAAVTGDWAGCARVVQHAMEPYQPQAYLGAGGLGSVTPTTVVRVSVPSAQTRALSLWNGSSNDSPPSSWQTSTFDDSAWALAQSSRIQLMAAQVTTGSPTVSAIWPSTDPASATQGALLRQHVTLPVGVLSAASLQIDADDSLLAVYVNGTLLVTSSVQQLLQTVSVPVSALVAGGDNVIAAHVANQTGYGHNVLLADSTFVDSGGGAVRTYYTAVLPAGYSSLYAVVTVSGSSWSTTGAAEDEFALGHLWWNTVLTVGAHTISDPAASYQTDGTARFEVQINNIGGPQTMRVQVYGTGSAGLAYALTASGTSTGGLPDPGGAAGDLLYYHGGGWTILPPGTSGQELTVVAGDPAWTDQPADSDYTDPLTSKGDLVARTSSATTREAVGSNGQVLTADSAQSTGIKWATPSASGVTSIDVAVPAPLSSSGGPVTSSGTITLSWTSGQAANRVLASPNGTTGAVSLRALVGNDIPVDASTIVVGSGVIKGNYQAGSGVSISGNTISATGSGGSVTSVTLSLPGIFTVSPATITTSGTFAVSLATQSVATVFAGPASGSAAAPTFRALAGSDLPAAAAAGGHIHAHGHFL